ncbi:hypothetical protein BN7_1655 [Wickerhamomyces ciferrii]|uniref:Secreted protein n=1 Tax=Wickerhamomyces ciferrii (strain ATCC 14091 / BCRC 22168 / CBS 111 / JCM 3599 / NBRC 0793 / NRRL Y-1031 F-60-10) TaxID=1206466 RepID=K0KIY1_WICCF|nr:uncharacterized protein BN7_1655 [Wickerhamomyces ciferrii]CCH42112.1 hypothetical protein BN7_1655 [Wickerhamomyces ciferrii]
MKLREILKLIVALSLIGETDFGVQKDEMSNIENLKEREDENQSTDQSGDDGEESSFEDENYDDESTTKELKYDVYQETQEQDVNKDEDIENKATSKDDFVKTKKQQVQKKFERSITPFKMLIDLVYGPNVLNCYPNQEIIFELPSQLKGQFPNFRDGQSVIPDLTFSVVNSSGKEQLYPLEIKLPSIKNLTEEIENNDKISFQNQGIWKKAIMEMLACGSEILFISDYNQTIMLHYQKNGDKGTEIIEQTNGVSIAEIPFQILLIDNTYQPTIKRAANMNIEQKITLEMIMLILLRTPFKSSGDSRKLLRKVLYEPRRVQEQHINFLKAVHKNNSSSFSSDNSLVPSGDIKSYNCELPYEDILSSSKNGDEYSPSVVLLFQKSTLEQLNILNINKESNDELVVLKIFDVEWSQIQFNQRYSWVYDGNFENYYSKYIYNDKYLKELRIMKRFQDYNDSINNDDDKINTPSLLGFGMLTSFGYNGPFIIESYVDCIQNKPSKEDHIKLGVEQYNRLLGIGINQNDIAERSIGFDETN